MCCSCRRHEACRRRVAPALHRGRRAKRGVRMAYGRLSVARDNYLGEAALVTPIARPPASRRRCRRRAARRPSLSCRARCFARQTGSEAAKKRALVPRNDAAAARRREEAGDAQRHPQLSGRRCWPTPIRRRTDILHEYFVPPERFARIPRRLPRDHSAFGQDLLNVTLRYLDADPVSVLSFAPAPRIAAVMLFPQA